MRITGISEGARSFQVRLDGQAEMEARSAIDFSAWRLDDGQLRLGSLRVLRRRALDEETEHIQATAPRLALVTADASLRMIGPDEPMAVEGSTRWEFTNPLAVEVADDAELATVAAVLTAQKGRPSIDEVIIDAPVTIETLLSAPENTPTLDGSPGEAKHGAGPKIDEAEARLGVTLPATLRQLYERQDGGYVNSLFVPDPNGGQPIRPFDGYNSLSSTDHLRTVHDSFLDFGDPNDDSYSSYFRDGVDKMVVLAKYYQETLFLDYRDSAEPRVGYTDFGNDQWPERIVAWDSFDAFLSALRHYEYIG